MRQLAGLGRSSRQKISQLNKAFKDTPFSVTEANRILQMNQESTSRFLSTLANNGWAKRIKRGHYFLIPAEAQDVDPISEDPWFVASKIFSPCYISGWSAAEHWGFTEQIFRSIFVITSKKIKLRKQNLAGAEFVIKTVKGKLIFGTTPVWRGKVKTLVADPSKLMIDLLDSPECGGGISHIIQIFKSYLKSEYRSLDKLLHYAKLQSSGAIFKRLGFLLEKLSPADLTTINECNKLISSGYSKLDPNLESDKIITRWKIWVPSFIEKDLTND